MTRLVIHADDVGMCLGANVAFAELSRRGTITAGSVMVPCPWFAEIAEMAVADATLDVGVHLTLNAEKRHYRWRPVSGAGPASGLVDADGYQWRTVAEVRRHADPDAVEAEWRAQVERALAAGIDVTHLDAHMGSALAPEWCDRYIALGAELGVPVLMTATLDAYGPRNHLEDVREERFAPFVEQARVAGMPTFDRVLETDFSRPATSAPDYEQLLSALGTCTVMTIRMYASRRDVPLENVSVRLAHDRIHAEDCETCETESGRIDRIRRWITLSGNLDEAQRQRLLEIADRCPVHRTLHGEILVETALA